MLYEVITILPLNHQTVDRIVFQIDEITAVIADFVEIARFTGAVFIVVNKPVIGVVRFVRTSLIFINRITSYNVCYTKLLRGVNYEISAHHGQSTGS